MTKKIDYPGAPNNFKYHSLDDLERLMENLKSEISRLESIQGFRGGRHSEQMIEENKRMLNEAEFEIMERALLQVPNEGGASD